MDQVSRGWLIYELTDSALQLGLVRGVQAIPTLLLSPVAGSTADRYSRKMQIMIAQVADGLMLAALAVLIFTGRIEPWHVYVTAFGMAVVQAFQQPARAAIIADTIPSTHLTNARPKFDHLQCGAHHWPSFGRRADCDFRNRRLVCHPSGVLSSRDDLDDSASSGAAVFAKRWSPCRTARFFRSQYHRRLEIQLAE